MKKAILFVLLVAFSAGSLFAVDLTNKDAESVHVKVDYGHQVIEYDHPAGYTYENICSNCKITIGGATMEVMGSQKVAIQGGKAVSEE